VSERRSFVTVIRWPSGWQQPERIGALVAALGLDPYDAEMVATRPAPLPVGILTLEQPRDAAWILREKRVAALAVSSKEIDDLADPTKAKRLVVPAGEPPGFYMVEPWRGEGRGLSLGRVVLMVRGRIVRSKTTTTVDTSDPYFMLDMVGGREGRVARELLDDGTGAAKGLIRESRDAGSTEVLDLWLEDGSCVRVDGRKFNFDVLGKKGHCDAQNSAALGLMLAEQAPTAEVDQGFSDFRPPTAFRVPLVSRGVVTVSRDDSPMFDFYSRWNFIVPRAVRRAKSAAG